LFQSLVAAGYAVFAPNFRGSSGRGREFMQMVHGDWGGDEQGDIAEAGRWLQHQAWIDEDRVGVIGRSFGGYSTYCQLTMYPQLWATGVAIVGMTDLQALYEESMPHFKSTLEDFLGDPDENEARYRERSPVEHVDAISAPVYVIHGENDPRCPLSQAELFRAALEEKGWTAGKDGEFEYTVLGEEGHGSTDVEQRVRVYDLLTDFLRRRL
jgi:dipeptidyl aminopeptidase/acylaminoacyl peptidase